MDIEPTKLPGVLLLTPKLFGDARGWFTESWTRRDFARLTGLDVDFVQDNHSYSAERGTLRGLHFQRDPKAQAKLLRCTRGRIYDVAVDLRRGSPDFAHWVGVELSADNHRQLFIPRGFAHGFLTLTDDVEVQYKADNYYAPDCEANVRWDDPRIAVDWPLPPSSLSAKDAAAPSLDGCAALNFRYEVP